MREARSKVLRWAELEEDAEFDGCDFEHDPSWGERTWKQFEATGYADYSSESEREVALARFKMLTEVFNDFWALAWGKAVELTAPSEYRGGPLSRLELRADVVENLKVILGGLSGVMNSLIATLPNAVEMAFTDDEFDEMIKLGHTGDIPSRVGEFSRDRDSRIARWVGEGCQALRRM